MTYILVFDAGCELCSAVAAKAEEAAAGKLEVRAASDPGIARLRGTNERPSKPLLLRLSGSEARPELRQFSGWALRWRLARLLGVRRALELQGMVSRGLRAEGISRKAFLKRSGVGAGLATITTVLLPTDAVAGCRDIHCNAWRNLYCYGGCRPNTRWQAQQRTCFGPNGGKCYVETRSICGCPIPI